MLSPPLGGNQHLEEQMRFSRDHKEHNLDTGNDMAAVTSPKQRCPDVGTGCESSTLALCTSIPTPHLITVVPTALKAGPRMLVF